MIHLKKLFYFIMLPVAHLCQAQTAQKNYPDYLQPDHAINAVSMVMIHDVVSPPVAGRYYAYAMLGAYYIVSANNKSVPPLPQFIKNFPIARDTDTISGKSDYQIAAYYSILEISRQLLPSGYLLKDDEDAFVQLLQKTHVEQTIIDNSLMIAEKAAKVIVDFSKTDHYNKLSALRRYSPLRTDSNWYPTPPGYFEAVEPNWRTINTVVIESANQFKPARCVPFSKDTASAFYKQVKAVYDVSKHLTIEQINQALFWDCNPFAITTSGHMAIGFKKISPGGHWMNIAGLAVRKAKLPFDQSIMVLALEGVTLMDAFISCWAEKYASNRVRPETFINKFMDIRWKPVLQTPPFPEYTSGHAVISNASAELLTYLLGDHFAYTDDTEIPFGSGSRSFTSFREAAAEASVSRFYGGIHYMESIQNGNEQGVKLGGYIIEIIKRAGIVPLTY